MKALLILLFLQLAHAQTNRPEWVQETNRTQGGGWIWFPGKHSSSNVEEARMIARGKAIDYLMTECTLPHNEVRFVEDYEEVQGSVTTVWTRASITHDQCKTMKYGSPVENELATSKHLMEIYKEYKTWFAHGAIDSKICNTRKALQCFEMAANEMAMGSKLVASAYAKIACSGGHSFSCTLWGHLEWQLGNPEKAYRIFTSSCANGEKRSCGYKQEMEKLASN